MRGEVKIGALCLIITSTPGWGGSEVKVTRGPDTAPTQAHDRYLNMPWWLVESTDGKLRPVTDGCATLSSIDCWFPESALMPLDPPDDLKIEELRTVVLDDLKKEQDHVSS